MRLAYLDTSCLVALTFGEPSADGIRALLASYDRLLSSNLLEAEWRAALSRERLFGVSDDVLRVVDWVLPNRSLSPEIARVIGAGYLRGADAWHLACALYLDPSAEEMSVLTLDSAQRAVAKALGFDAPGTGRTRRGGAKS